MKRFLLAIPTLLFLAVFFPALKETSQQHEIQEEQPTQDIIEQPITLLFVGDIMLDRGVEWKVKTVGNNDWTYPFAYIQETLSNADLTFGNLESIISNKGVKVGSIYSFRADPASIEALTFAGFDVLSIANNHSFDYTREALEDTLLYLQDAGISFTGGGFTSQQAISPLVKEIRETKIAFFGYTNLGSPLWQATETQAGIAWADSASLPFIAKSIQGAKTESDIVVVSLHAGEEYTQEPNAFQKTFAQAAIDAGADLVVMHHAHVVQPLEQYRQGWIAYGLGNFLFDQKFSEETMQGAMLKVTLQNSSIQNVEMLRTSITDSFQVQLKQY